MKQMCFPRAGDDSHALRTPLSSVSYGDWRGAAEAADEAEEDEAEEGEEEDDSSASSPSPPSHRFAVSRGVAAWPKMMVGAAPRFCDK